MLACLAALHVACEASGLLMLILQLQLDFSDKKDLLALQSSLMRQHVPKPVILPHSKHHGPNHSTLHVIIEILSCWTASSG